MKGYIKVLAVPLYRVRVEMHKKLAEVFLLSRSLQRGVTEQCLIEVPRKFLFWNIPTCVMNATEASRLAPVGISYGPKGFYKDEEFEGIMQISELMEESSELYLDAELYEVWKKIIKEPLK